MKLFDSPKILSQKIVVTVFIGLGCFIIGAAYFLFSRDKITFLLSLFIFAFSAAKGFGLYRTVSAKKYDIVEGTCIGVTLKPFNKQFIAKIVDDAGIETILRLGKQSKLKIGFRYRFYFAQGGRLSVGSEYFDTALTSNHFLGFEELGEYGVQERSGHDEEK